MVETAVIDWVGQVSLFLKKDSSELILNRIDSGPMAEIEFWNTRTSNLEEIYEQVNIGLTENCIS